MRHLILLLSAFVVLFVGGWTPPADADPVCVGVSATGTVTGDRQVGQCVPYPYAVLCVTRTAGIDPTAVVTVSACVPI